jgi:hypothetical protein
MTKDRKTYRWIPGTLPDDPFVFLNENGYITKYNLQALEAALAVERAATRPTGRHVCGYRWERDRLIRIKKFEAGLALLTLIQLPHLCDSCTLEFPTCRSTPTFGIDRYPTATGKEADKVLSCDAYTHAPTNNQD